MIEGTCRSLVKNRLGVTGARWGLAGAEAVLRLRAVDRSGDWEAYWAFHEAQEEPHPHASVNATSSLAIGWLGVTNILVSLVALWVAIGCVFALLMRGLVQPTRASDVTCES